MFEHFFSPRRPCLTGGEVHNDSDEEGEDEEEGLDYGPDDSDG